MEHQSGAALYQEHLNTAMEQLRSDWSAEDLRAALRPDVLANAQLLERSLRNGEGDIRGWLVLGWVYFYRIRAQGSPASREDWIAAATAFAPCFIAEVEPLPEILLPTIVDLAANRAVALLRKSICRRFARSSDCGAASVRRPRPMTLSGLDVCLS